MGDTSNVSVVVRTTRIISFTYKGKENNSSSLRRSNYVKIRNDKKISYIYLFDIKYYKYLMLFDETYIQTIMQTKIFSHYCYKWSKSIQDLLKVFK